MQLKPILAGLLALAMLLPGAATRAQEATKEYLFVQTGSAAEFRDGVLTLSGIGPVTTYFADRPGRDVGLVTQDEFLAAWSAGGDSFAADPPNASLTFRDGDKQVVAVVELSNPALVDGGIRYDAKLLEGELPASLGPASLFIDAGGLMQLVAYGAQD